jgi:hypothetical protein
MGENHLFAVQIPADLEPTKIKYRIDNAFHMLRHFEGVDEQLQASLLKAGHVEKTIQAALTLPGSRFFADFASDIPSLLNRVFLHPFVVLETGDRNIQLNGQVSRADFPNGIGTKAVIHVDELTASERADIFLKKNRGLDLLHLSVDRIPPTWEFTLVLRPTQQGHVFITAFPGPPAMPLPQRRLGRKRQEECKAFWDKHVFLVEGAKGGATYI